MYDVHLPTYVCMYTYVRHQLGAQLLHAHLVHLSTDLVLFEGLEAFFKVRTVSCVANGLVCIGPAQSWFRHADNSH